MFQPKARYLASILCILSLLTTQNTPAQIIPDNSLGQESSQVSPNVEVKGKLAELIQGGAIRDNNLFHSFSEFNVRAGERVYFANPEAIANILTRVTGNNASEILGTLGVNGDAHLFLLNPNGILVGKEAQLDVAGSFVASTADSLVFNNGFAFSASKPDVPPLLTVNMPIGLQFGTKAEAITNRAQLQGIDLIGQPTTVGLQVQPEQNLILLGGDLNLEAGGLTAPYGRIELGSVAPNSYVSLQPEQSYWTLNYQAVSNFQDILLTQAAKVESSGGRGMQIQGRKIALLDRSQINAHTLERDAQGTVKIQASDSIELTGNDSLYEIRKRMLQIKRQK
jgi:filamentous hemagglutinin family protein